MRGCPMARKRALLVALTLVAVAVALTPEAAADHTCGGGDDELTRTVVYVCEGWHGGYCEGKYLNYGWYGRCI